MYSRIILLCLFTLAFAMQALSVGALFVRPLNSNQTYETISIRQYDATADIQDHVATTHVVQTFKNETSWQVESTFIFPLPPGAVITELFYWFNGKKYKANVRERAEAQRSYDSKIRVRIDPALLQEISENLFKLNIAPINANSDVKFEITYTEILPFALGQSTYSHFLKTTGLSPKPVERMTLTINANSSSPWQTIESPSYQSSPAHTIVFTNPNQARITLGDEGFVPTKNYLLNLRVARADVDMGTLTYTPVEADSFGNDPFFLSWVIPPDEEANPIPRSAVFVADVSSSMEGKRIEQLRDAMQLFLDQLRPSDRFNIITFSTGVLGYKEDLVDATPENIASAKAFVQGRTALGLTNIHAALNASLHQSFRPETANFIVFLTDGQPSWGETREAVILDSMNKWNAGAAVIYPITVGEEPSINLMRKLASNTGGFLTEIASDDDIIVLVKDHLLRISMPNLTNLSLDYGGLQTVDVVPQTLPNVPIGGRVTQAGRYKQGGTYPVSLTGNMGSNPFTLTKSVFFGDPLTNNRAVARLWAQAKITSLLDEISRNGEAKELVDAIIDLSIRFAILTKYTALYSDPTEDDPVDDGNPTGVPEDQRPVEMRYICIAPMPVTENSIATIQLPPSYTGRHLVVRIIDLFGREVSRLYDGISIIGPLELRIQNSEFGIRNVAHGTWHMAPGTYTLVAEIDGEVWSLPFVTLGGN